MSRTIAVVVGVVLAVVLAIVLVNAMGYGSDKPSETLRIVPNLISPSPGGDAG